MTTNHENDAATDDLMDTFDDIDDLEDLEELESPIGDAASVAADALESGTLPLIGGGLALVAAIRSMAANRRRAIPLAIVGTGLVGFGLSKRGSSGEPATETDVPDVEAGTDGKETADEAGAAAERVDSGRESEIQSDGDISAEPGIDDADDSSSEIDFTEEPDEDESRSRPDLGADEEEPRRKTDTDGVEVDVSDSAMADETSEATGPDPTQAQPTQTEDTEPEESPADDASHMKVDPPDADESDSETNETDAADATESGESER
ncbi:hypothetical protein CP556_10085 [Natrinema sp. CBA1119]|uniref:hypothetical protein n=1 Tax=Natrinema sp. CBA1119 TaxID=1608465 RepID=UPI000BF4F0FF|nr:hypothetical protein [Natrinema sp. CBA1119]PGF16433.1 hypothetical protein CP556_10085 [Natrinema sp. CBA1119]